MFTALAAKKGMVPRVNGLENSPHICYITNPRCYIWHLEQLPWRI